MNHLRYQNLFMIFGMQQNAVQKLMMIGMPIEAYKKDTQKMHDELSRRISGNMPDNFDQIYSAFLDQCNKIIPQWRQEKHLKYV